MKRTQVYLDESSTSVLRTIALETGRKQSEIIREAIAEYVAKHSSGDVKANLKRARGLWKDRDDLSAVETLRAEWETRLDN